MGDGPDSQLYWCPDYNAPHRGFLLADELHHIGIICEQGCNPFSKDGILSREAISASSICEAIERLESFCDETGYAIHS